MRLKLGVSALSLFFGFAAMAHVPVERMTCSKAQAYVKAHNGYWKDAGPDGEIPIYPVFGLGTANCGGRTITNAQMERTLDNKHCILGYYCNSY